MAVKSLIANYSRQANKKKILKQNNDRLLAFTKNNRLFFVKEMIF